MNALLKNISFLLLLSLALNGYAQSSEEGPLGYREQAMKAFEANDFQGALSLLDNSLKVVETQNLVREKPKIYKDYARIWVELKEYSSARKYLTNAMELSDSLQLKELYEKSHLLLLHSYVMEGGEKLELYQEGFPLLQRTMQENRSANEVALLKMDVKVLFDQGNFEGAKATSEDGLRLLGRSSAFDLGAITNEEAKAYTSYFRLFKAVCQLEGNIRDREGFNTLTEVAVSDLDPLMTISAERYKLESMVNLYKCKLYSNRDGYQDSAKVYMDKYLAAEQSLVSFIEERSRQKNLYKVAAIEKEKALQLSELEHENNRAQLKITRILIILFVVLIIVCVFGIFLVKRRNRYRLAIHNQEKQQNELLISSIAKKERMEHNLNTIQDTVAMDLHDNFGNRLAAIKSSSDILMDLKESKVFEDPTFKKFFTHLEGSVNLLYAEVKDLIWSNNSENNKLSKVVERIERVTLENEISQECQTSFEHELDREYHLPMFWNRHILVIIKELMKEATSHVGSSDRCGFDLKIGTYNNEFITVCAMKDKIADDGFDERFLIAKKRAENINFTLNYYASDSKITKMVLSGTIKEIST